MSGLPPCPTCGMGGTGDVRLETLSPVTRWPTVGGWKNVASHV